MDNETQEKEYKGVRMRRLRGKEITEINTAGPNDTRGADLSLGKPHGQTQGKNSLVRVMSTSS